MDGDELLAGELCWRHLGRVVLVPERMRGMLLAVSHVSVGGEPGVHLTIGAELDSGWCVAVSCDPSEMVLVGP